MLKTLTSRQERHALEREIEALPGVAEAPAGLAARLARAGALVTLPANWVVVSERTPGDHAYLLLEGTVDVLVEGAPVATLGAGSLFGERAMLHHRLRSASVVARTAVRLLSLDEAGTHLAMPLITGAAAAS